MKPTIIPAVAQPHHAAVLGKTGSGKTSTAKLLVEEAVANGHRVCVLDPIKSDWWGLTLSADGHRPGLPFDILGGPKGHVPLHSGAGAAIAELVAAGTLPHSIIDMADFEPGGLQRFFVEFAPALIRRMRGVLYLVIEEAHEFAPKERSGIGQEAMAIHWAKKMATAGRSKGIRLVVATQRTQALHNALLGSCDTLVAHRVTSPADQEPVVKWLRANTDKATADDVAASLATLKTGEGWLCSGEASVFERRQFPRIKTYDNSATPTGDDHGDGAKPPPVDQARLRTIIGDAVAQAEADDPKKLREELARVKGELKKALSAPVSVPPAEVQTLRADLERWQAAARADANTVRELRESLQVVYREAETALASEEKRTRDAEAAFDAARPARSEPPRREPPPRPVTVRDLAKSSPAAAGNGGDLPKPLLSIVLSIAWWDVVGFRSPTRAQVAAVAGYAVEGGSFKRYVSELSTRGLVEYGTGTLSLTPAGAELIVPPSSPPTLAELHERVEAIMENPHKKIFRVLLEAGGRDVGRTDLAERSGHKGAEGGSFKRYVSALSSLGVVKYGRSTVRAADWLFPEGLR